MNVLRGLPRSNVEEIDKRWQGRRLHQGEAAARSGLSARPCAGGGNAPARRAPNALLDGWATELAPAHLLSTAVLPATEHSTGRARLYLAVADEVRQTAWKADIVCRAECPSDLSQQEICLLVDRVAELERELANANRYLEACREVIGAREGELLLDAIRRRSQELAQPSSR